MRSLIRYIAALIAITAVFVSLLYVACEAVHDCEGGNCPVCAQINFFQTSLKASPDPPMEVVEAPARCFSTPRTLFSLRGFPRLSPVSLKTILLN